MKKHLSIRVFALLLCIFCTLPLAACQSKEEPLPDGMQNATAAGDDFRLYVPTTWNINTAYGISGAYYNLNDQSTVSMVKYPITQQMENAMKEDTAVSSDQTETRLDWFFRTTLKVQSEALSTGGVEETEKPAADVLDGVNARRYHYTATIKGQKLFFVQVVAEKGGAFYVFSFTATENLYKMLYNENRRESNVGAILSNFVFADPYVPADGGKQIKADENTPDGMKPASNDDVMYNFYVPKDWVPDLNQKVYSAKSPDGLAVVSVTPFMPAGDALSVVSYFEQTEKMLKTVAGNTYQKQSEKETTLGGGAAMQYEYRMEIGGTAYRYRQIIGNYRGMIYSLTYTAREADFDKHLNDMDAITNAFTYR